MSSSMEVSLTVRVKLGHDDADSQNEATPCGSKDVDTVDGAVATGADTTAPTTGTRPNTRSVTTSNKAAELTKLNLDIDGTDKLRCGPTNNGFYKRSKFSTRQGAPVKRASQKKRKVEEFNKVRRPRGKKHPSGETSIIKQLQYDQKMDRERSRQMQEELGIINRVAKPADKNNVGTTKKAR